MVEQLGKHPNICPYLHLPVQSGSDRILRLMGRGYTRADYLSLVEQLRQARPELALSTDLIVGFPGETEADFEASLRLVREVRFASIFAFRYSPRPGTAAPRLPDRVDDATAERRLQKVLRLQGEIQRELNQRLVGSEMSVLVTGWGKTTEVLAGRTSCHRIVHFPATENPVRPGSLAQVIIEKANPHSLMGRPAGSLGESSAATG
jgi:tRNA-2-methylthio-N6-dimethylallyladenosine synthase